MPLIINPDGQTAHFDATERIRLAERWASTVPASASHDGTQVVAVNAASAELSGQAWLHSEVNAGHSSLEARCLAHTRALIDSAGIRGATTISGSVTGRMSGGPWPFDNLSLRGRTADHAIVDDLEDIRAMGLTTRVHDELRIEMGTSRDDVVDPVGAALAWWRENHRPLQPVASRALVPVSAPQQKLPAERFNKALLQEIDRPVYHTLLAERKRMREHWTRLMTEKAEALYTKGVVVWGTFRVTDATLWGMPESPLMREVDRVMCMLVQDDRNVEDIVAFSLRTVLSERNMQHVRGILLCYGLGGKDYHLISTDDFKGTL